MDKLCKKIMEFMRRNGTSTAYSCSICDEWNEYSDSPFHELVDSLKEDPNNISSALSALVSDGWLEYKNLYSSTGDIHISVCMTHKGLHQKEYEQMDLKNFILKSLLVPVLVSVLTAALVSGMGYLWTMSGIKINQVSQQPSNAPTIEETMRTASS